MAFIVERTERESMPFPATRFYGSKRKHLKWIRECLARIEYSTVLDLFGGTGSVSMLFESMGKDVYYHDSAKFNYRQARGLFGGARSQDFDSVEAVIKGIRPVDGFISQSFHGHYFTELENKWLDGYVDASASLRNHISRDILFYCVAQASLQKRPFNLFHRRNLGLRLNGKDRTFGNAATWEKSFADLALRHLEVARRYVQNVRGFGNVQALKPAKPTAIGGGWDLVYLDPPYLRSDRHTETYTQRYHFLEGLSDPVRWQKHGEAATQGSFHSPTMTEPWGDKAEFSGLLEQLLSTHSDSVVAMSYMDGGVPSTKELRRLFTKNFSKVRVFTTPVQRALSSSSGAEILIVGLP